MMRHDAFALPAMPGVIATPAGGSNLAPEAARRPDQVRDRYRLERTVYRPPYAAGSLIGREIGSDRGV
jgi:hypothetical protein